MNTSYFDNPVVRYLSNPVSIISATPYAFEGLIYEPLFPPMKLYVDHKNRHISNEDYDKYYRLCVLNKLNPRKVLEDIGINAILLCWEKSNIFSHRYIVAKWMHDNLGLVVREIFN